MARIRSIKPEFWEDEVIGLLSRDARLLYIAIWNMADDEGLLRWSSSYIKANAFMYDDDLGVDDVTRLMKELEAAGLILPYVAGKTRQSLAWVVTFSRHQKPNRPQPSKLPPPSLRAGPVFQAYIRRDANTCHLCGHECSTEHDKPKLFPSLDHVQPRSQGGSDYPSNVLLTHVSCNKARGDRPVDECGGSAAVLRSMRGSRSDSLNDSPPEGRGYVEEVERETEGSIAPDKPTRAAREPDDVWDALLDACSVDPANIPAAARGAYNAATKQLRDIGATPGDIRRRAAIYRGQWPGVSLTPTALARRWAECDRPASTGPQRTPTALRLDAAEQRAEAAEAKQREQRRALP